MSCQQSFYTGIDMVQSGVAGTIPPPIPKTPNSVYEQVFLNGDGILSPSTWGIVLKNSANPVDFLGNAAQAVGADYAGDLTRRVYWRYNHPLAITNEIGRAIGRSAGFGKVYTHARTAGSRTLPPGIYDTPATALFGAGLVASLDLLSGNVNVANTLQGGRPDGFQAVLPKSSDPRETTNLPLELLSRYVFGRTGRLLPWEQFKEERPDIGFEQYTNYQNYLRGQNPTLLGLENIPSVVGLPAGAATGALVAKVAGGRLSKGATLGAIAGGLLTGAPAGFLADQGIIKGTLDGIDGPEIRAVGYRVPLSALVGTAAVGAAAHYVGSRLKRGQPLIPVSPNGRTAGARVINADAGKTIPRNPDFHPGYS